MGRLALTSIPYAIEEGSTSSMHEEAYSFLTNADLYALIGR